MADQNEPIISEATIRRLVHLVTPYKSGLSTSEQLFLDHCWEVLIRDCQDVEQLASIAEANWNTPIGTLVVEKLDRLGYLCNYYQAYDDYEQGEEGQPSIDSNGGEYRNFAYHITAHHDARVEVVPKPK